MSSIPAPTAPVQADTYQIDHVTYELWLDSLAADERLTEGARPEPTAEELELQAYNDEQGIPF